MPHTALYRKKRPLTFSDVVGQRHIVKALSNQIMAGQVSHAYLFCGTRGTGKTSIARILARAVNCENPQNGNPCNVCEACTGILAERNLNVVEIDAASNNGVENIRDLRDEVKYQPTQGKYKVYIIDEVHMLSTSAFNALLKTLEEPPAHVIFILATTDTQKLPATILSRCQRYDFRRIAASDMVSTLQRYLQETDVEYEEKALDYIVYHSDGAMRDALSLLDQSLSLGEATLTYAQVLDMLGAVERSQLFELTDALVACDSAKVMAIISQAMDGGRDASQFVADLVRHFRDVLVASMVQDPGAVDFSQEIAENLREQGRRLPSQMLMEYIHVFSETLREMRFAPHARTAFEVCALRVCAPRVAVEIPVAHTSVAKPVEKPDLPPVVPIVEKPSAKTGETTPEIMAQIVAEWDILCHTFPNPMRSHCAQCGMEINDGKLEIVTGSDTTKDILKPKEGIIREKIADKFHLTTPPNLAFVVREGYNKVVKQPAPARSINIQPEPMQEKIPEPQMEQQAIPADWITPEAMPVGELQEDWDSLVAAAPVAADDDVGGWDAIGVEMTTDEDW